VTAAAFVFEKKEQMRSFMEALDKTSKLLCCTRSLSEAILK
jgi:hypothetical protein